MCTCVVQMTYEAIGCRDGSIRRGEGEVPEAATEIVWRARHTDDERRSAPENFRASAVLQTEPAHQQNLVYNHMLTHL